VRRMLNFRGEKPMLQYCISDRIMAQVILQRNLAFIYNTFYIIDLRKLCRFLKVCRPNIWDCPSMALVQSYTHRWQHAC
jgi:hypothetical protein